METIKVLYEHIKSSKDFENSSEFLDILEKANAYLENQSCNDKIKVVRCINIEGIDGVGKTTLANALACCSRISGYLLSVPSNLRSFRPYFDKQNESVKRHFFHLWDIIVSERLLSFPDTTVVIILDRYWPTSFTYRLANQTESASLDEHFPIHWPSYLVRPSHIFYIHVNEDERHRRILQRQTTIPISDEEHRISSDPEFRSRFDKIYRQIPEICPIDGDQPTEKIIDRILELYQQSSAKIT